MAAWAEAAGGWRQEKQRGTGGLGADQHLGCDDGFISMCVYMRGGHTYTGQIDQITHFKYVQFIYYTSVITQ